MTLHRYTTTELHRLRTAFEAGMPRAEMARIFAPHPLSSIISTAYGCGWIRPKGNTARRLRWQEVAARHVPVFDFARGMIA